MIVVPQPPALDLTPASPRAVVTVATGAPGRELLDASGPAMRAFAARVGADFVVLDWPGHESWPMSAKYAVGRVLDHYERILYADADVLFRDGCVDPFSLCPPDRIGLCDELPFHRTQPQHGLERSYVEFRRAFGFRDLPSGSVPWYANAGVAVIPKEARHLFLPPDFALPPTHLAEQHLLNARLLDGAFPVALLDRRCNWQNWTDWTWANAPDDAVLHWSGAGFGRRNRAAEIALARTKGSPVTRAAALKSRTAGLAVVRASFAARDARSARLTICESCPDRRGERCGRCGCSIKTRASRRDGTCPAGRWPLEVVQ